MSFTVSSGTLTKHLRSISGVIASNPVVPILENVLFEVGRGVLRTTASDLQTTVISEIPVESQVETSLAVPAKILLDTLASLHEQPLRFEITEDTYTLHIITDNGKFRIACENAVDFVKLPKIAAQQSVTLQAGVLHRAITSTLFAASTEELRPAMGGVYVQMEDDHTLFVATDGHRLVRYKRTDITATEPVSFIMPRKSLAFLRNLLPADRSQEVTLTYNQSNAQVTFGDTIVYLRLVDERFPDYKAAIPARNPNVLTIERLELLDSLKRIALYTNKGTGQVRWRLTSSELTLSAEDTDFSNEGREQLPCDFTGEPMEIGFSAKMMIEMLNNVESQMVRVELSAPNRPGLIIPADQDLNEDTLMLIMPIMLSSYAPA